MELVVKTENVDLIKSLGEWRSDEISQNGITFEIGVPSRSLGFLDADQFQLLATIGINAQLPMTILISIISSWIYDSFIKVKPEPVSVTIIIDGVGLEISHLNEINREQIESRVTELFDQMVLP
jgi:hypothetical protein